MARVLLTGGTGFLGRALQGELTRAGHHVVITTSNLDRISDFSEGQSFVKADFTDHKTHSPWFWKEFFVEQGIDFVINNAGVLGGNTEANIEAINFKAPAALAEACNGLSTPPGFMQVSSICTELPNYGNFHYSRTKRAMDDLLPTLTRLPSTIIRTNIVFSEGGWGHKGSFDDLARMFMIPIGGEGSAVFQPIHLSDLAKIAHLVPQTNEGKAKKSGTEILYAAGPQSLSFHDLLQVVRPIDTPFVHAHIPFEILRKMAQSFPYGIACEESVRMLEDQEKNGTFKPLDTAPFCEACNIPQLRSIFDHYPMQKSGANPNPELLRQIIVRPLAAIRSASEILPALLTGAARIEQQEDPGIEELRQTSLSQRSNKRD